MQKLKCISLYQPYATLCVTGAKRFETRSWDARYRGLVEIHATKTMPDWCKDVAGTPRFLDALMDAGFASAKELTLAAVIGTVEIINTVRSDVWLTERMIGKGVIDPEWENEFHFGDYGGGRFAWELANPIIFDEPIPAKGSQGFWFLNT